MEKQNVAFLRGISTRELPVPFFAYSNAQITRKRLCDADYVSNKTNTFRVIGDQAQMLVQPNWIAYQNSDRLPPSQVINEPLVEVPYPLKEEIAHHIPHSKVATFIRTNVRQLNAPVWAIEPTKDLRSEIGDYTFDHEHRPSPARIRCLYAADVFRTASPATLMETAVGESTYKSSYLGGDKTILPSTRHGSNTAYANPGRGIVPVTDLRDPDDDPRLWKESISFKHDYDSRKNPNIPYGLKKPPSFVWGRIRQVRPAQTGVEDKTGTRLVPPAPAIQNSAPYPTFQDPHCINVTTDWQKAPTVKAKVYTMKDLVPSIA